MFLILNLNHNSITYWQLHSSEAVRAFKHLFSMTGHKNNKTNYYTSLVFNANNTYCGFSLSTLSPSPHLGHLGRLTQAFAVDKLYTLTNRNSETDLPKTSGKSSNK